MKLDLYGEVTVNLGTTPQGQGHETTAAQVVADILGMKPDQVHVTAGFNQRQNTYVAFSGTYASQFAVTGLGAAEGAAEKLRGEIVSRGLRSPSAPRPQEIELAGRHVLRARRPRAGDPVHRHRRNLVYANNAALPDELRRRRSASTAATSTCRRSRFPTPSASAAT